MDRQENGTTIIMLFWIAYILMYIVNFVQIFTTSGSTQIIKVVGAIFGIAPITVWF